ncbi:hypothetical protein TeGR_g1783, partial [Tetraparma gracilis]
PLRCDPSPPPPAPGVQVDSEQVYGAKFFGGLQEKEVLFDENAEASVLRPGGVADAKCLQPYASLFDTRATAELANSLADAIGGLPSPLSYPPSLPWVSPFSLPAAAAPPARLAAARSFFPELDLAFVAGSSSPSPAGGTELTLHWLLSLSWPALHAPRVRLSGVSSVEVDKGGVVRRQEDELLSDGSVEQALARQLPPSFWDT